MSDSWTGFKELILVDKVVECKDVVSFYFKDKDNKKLPKHNAGQFLPIKMITSDSRYAEQIRTYSLSMVPNEDMYRISVKRAPNGLISNYLHDNLNVGDSVLAGAPCGLFVVNEKSKNNHITLLSGGIGVTPLLSMLFSEINNREMTIVEAVQNSENHPFKNTIESLSNRDNVKRFTLYSAPSEEDIENKCFDSTGFVTKEWIAENLDLNSSFYFCGPPIFMGSINKALLELGITEDRIHYESF